MPYLGRTPSAVPVTADDIPANSIDASKIIDGSIELAEISDGAITSTKLATAVSDDIATGVAKVSITSAQASDITTNNAKVTNSDQSKADIEALGIAASSITGALPAIDGSALSGVDSNYVKTSHTTSGTVSNPSTTWAAIPGATLTHSRGTTAIGSKHIVTFGLATYTGDGGSGCGFKLQRSYDNSAWSDIYNPADGWGMAGYGGATSAYTSFTYVDTMTTTNSTVYYRIIGKKWTAADTYYFNYAGYPKTMSFVVQEVRA